MSSAADSYIFHDHMSASSDNDELDSLPSISSSAIDSEADSDAQAEWERSLEQLKLLLTMVIVPFAGKFMGRKFAYWSMEPLLSGLGPDRAAVFAQVSE